MVLVLMCADDITLLSTSSQQVQALLDVLSDFCQDARMQINVAKIMIVALSTGTHHSPYCSGRRKGKQYHREIFPNNLGLQNKSGKSFDVTLADMLQRGQAACAWAYFALKSLKVGQPIWVALHPFKACVGPSSLCGVHM